MLSSRKVSTLDELKNDIKEAYEKMSWFGFDDGSMGEARDDGEAWGQIHLLYDIGQKLNLDLIPPPDDCDERYDEGDIEWHGNLGVVDVSNNAGS